jgi:hypothetical protein
MRQMSRSCKRFARVGIYDFGSAQITGVLTTEPYTFLRSQLSASGPNHEVVVADFSEQ